MRTCYADLDIVVDEQAGRAKVRRAEEKPKKVAKVRPPEGYDSKLEADRARYLYALQLAGDIVRVEYHPFTVKIGKTKKYTPDFRIQWKDGTTTIEEIKGHPRQKGARDGLTRLDVAAAAYPQYRWYLVRKI
jgi:hypothetical protein